ncbi:MAG: hypothetical protein IKE03_06140 [Blautia sp.]|nr:hypothetical protein [Blautia sp.]
MRPQLYFDETALSTFGIYISGEGTYNAPERSVREEVIPGRNGTLVIDNGRFENIVVSYPAFILDDFAANIKAARNYLSSRRGYVRIRDTYHPGEYRLGVYAAGLEIDTSGHGNIHGKFNLIFNCKPQRFLTAGDTPVTISSGASITNPTLFPSRPLIRVTGTGALSLGGVEMTITGTQEYTDIDCDLMDCYAGSVNLNRYVSIDGDEFPELAPGENVLVYDGPTAVQITPRWWTV